MESFYLLLLKHLLILKIFPVTLFKELVAVFRNLPVTVKPACYWKGVRGIVIATV
jgi:hypothetical protein